MKQAQISIELLFVFGIVLVLFIFLLLFIADKKYEVLELSYFLEAKKDCAMLSTLISSVYTIPDANITIITHTNATLDDDIHLLEVNKYNRTAYCPLLVTPIRDISGSSFTIPAGNVTITHVNGTVVITHA